MRIGANSAEASVSSSTLRTSENAPPKSFARRCANASSVASSFGRKSTTPNTVPNSASARSGRQTGQVGNRLGPAGK